MPVGPQGQKRPKTPNAAAVMVGKIATGRSKEEYVEQSEVEISQTKPQT